MSQSYSDDELRNMQIAAKISAMTSILGSGFIVLEILHKKRWLHQLRDFLVQCACWTLQHNPNTPNQQTPTTPVDSSALQHKRSTLQNILLGMCLFDGMSSIGAFIGSWAIPQGTEGVFQPRGTSTTCAVQGFAIQLLQALPLYNLMLALYFWLVIHARCHDTVLHQHQWAFHILPVGFAVATASWGVADDQFDNAILWCWFAGRSNSDTFRLALFYGPVWAAMGMAIFLLYSVYSYVRKQEHRVQRDMEQTNQRMQQREEQGHHQHRRQESFLQSASSSYMPSSVDGGEGASYMQYPSKMVSSHQIDKIDEEEPQEQSHIAKEQSNNEHSPPQQSQNHDDDPMEFPPEKSLDEPRNGHDDHTKSSTEESPQHRLEDNSLSTRPSAVAPTKMPNHNSALQQKAARYSKTVFWQGFWYAAAFALTYSFATMVRVMESFDQTVPHELFVLMCLTLPGQGFLNLLVYKRLAIARCYCMIRHRLRPPPPPPRRYPKTRIEEEARRREQANHPSSCSSSVNHLQVMPNDKLANVDDDVFCTESNDLNE